MIYVIGISGEVSSKIRQQVINSKLLIGTDRLLQHFPEYPGEVWQLKDIRSVLTNLKNYYQQNPQHYIVILTSGDPLFYGLGRILLEYFLPECLEFQPGVSSVQLAFSRLRIPWQSAVIVSVHGRSMANLVEVLKQMPAHIAVLTDRSNTPAAIGLLLEGLKLPIFYDCWVCENLGTNVEKISLFQPQTAQNFSDLLIVVLSRRQELPPINPPILGISDGYFASYPDQPGLITKQEIRLLTLGALQLQTDQIVWDIGAGTGSVAIEIARLVPSSQILAIEKNAIGITLLQKNCVKFTTENVTIISGQAPEILTDLPPPHRIFLGGSGGNLAEILQVCSTKILPKGILVANFASPEHAFLATEWFHKRSISCHSLLIQLSRLAPLATVSRYVPLTPIVQIKAQF